MGEFHEVDDWKVKDVFASYPESIQHKLLYLRDIIFEVAAELDVKDMQETLKWGEPSYMCKKGSTIRISQRRSNAQQYAIYFNCKTSLIDTFKEIYGDQFKYEGKRAIWFDEQDEIPIQPLKSCISAALTYHSRKHAPMLGM